MKRTTLYSGDLARHCDGCQTCTGWSDPACPEGAWLRQRVRDSWSTGDVPVGWHKENPRPRAAL